MLLQLRDYVQREGGVSINHLARVFHTDVSVLKAMLQTLVERGMIEPFENSNCQKSCRRCS